MAVERWGWAAIAGTSFIALAAGAHVFATLNGLDSGQNQAIAAWVQAVGSVAAIVGAFAIANRQSRNQHESAMQLDREKLRRSWSSAKAILDALVQQCLEVAPAFEGDGKFGNVAFAGKYEAESFQKALRRVDSIPLFELDSTELVTAVVGLQDEATYLVRWIDEGIKNSQSVLTDALSDAMVKEIAQGFLQRIKGHYAVVVDVTKDVPVQARPNFWRHINL
ncbi:hypothetical protein [Cupriavidus sp. UME77]|uniref:hypothetical protein n=1 Tax=Cupriavidus sp. UME77 TaxID=1862321 RepID=UPI0015FF0D2C|nr:hypothetical protein [Cupriavidus sp. UME77]MBB1630289.1 hypothetical protein [Cupriavidus sp. UME77]